MTSREKEDLLVLHLIEQQDAKASERIAAFIESLRRMGATEAEIIHMGRLGNDFFDLIRSFVRRSLPDQHDLPTQMRVAYCLVLQAKWVFENQLLPVASEFVRRTTPNPNQPDQGERNDHE